MKAFKKVFDDDEAFVETSEDSKSRFLMETFFNSGDNVKYLIETVTDFHYTNKDLKKPKLSQINFYNKSFNILDS